MMQNLLRKAGLQRLESLVLALMIALPAGFLVFGESVAFASGYEQEEGDEGEEHDEGDEHGGRGARQVTAPAAAAPGKLPGNAPASVPAAAVMNDWQNECGSCHIPFPARRLPAASWQRIMANLGDHYGTDAGIDDAALVASISRFLVANAGDPARYQDVKGAAVPLRITQTRWFVREHDELSASVWKRPSIKSAANCGACHQGAAEGNFSERDIRVPKQ